jgi:ParB-like chromosome segregation protein Spo0J
MVVTERVPLKVESIPVSELHLFEGNARRGDIHKIADSLSVNGQYKPIVVNRGTKTGKINEVLAGNHTLMAAQTLGWVFIDAVYVDVDRESAVRIVIADNQTSDSATNERDLLIDLIQELPDLAGTGFSDDDLAILLATDDGGGFGGPQVDEPYISRWEVVIECSDESEQEELFERLRDEGLRVRLLSL